MDVVRGEAGRAWPLFDLRLRTQKLEMRVPTDDDLEQLAVIARQGLHDPTLTVFEFPAWEELPSPEFERQFMQYFWGLRANWQPGNWTLALAAIVNGRPIGVQEISAKDFAHRRSVASGSWIGQQYQGRGYGTEMRGAVLWLAFECLHAIVAESAYLEANSASARVSEKLGYVPNGERITAPKGEPVRQHLVRVTPASWIRDRVTVSVENLDPCLDFFGLTARSAG